MAQGRARSGEAANRTTPVDDYEHSQAKRSNNPPSGLAHLDRDPTPVKTLAYDPHLDPQLVWAGKAERETVDIPAPSVHVHEELSAQKIIGSVRRQRLQQPLFDLDTLDPTAAVEFYQHNLDWSNRMVLGDSLIVMTSLLERERLAGKVQCVFIDPPYGIKYQSNFQPNISDRNVRDGKDESLTREPEMIQAYRDTWELGTHSYLTYLRDRFRVAHELLTDSGSIFVQIGEENVHRVRTLLDEIFGAENFVSQITVVTTSGGGAQGELLSLPSMANYLVWYARDHGNLKYRQLYTTRGKDSPGAVAYSSLELADGTRRRITPQERESGLPEGARAFQATSLSSQAGNPWPNGQFPVTFQGREFRPSATNVWKTSIQGFAGLIEANRVVASGNTLRYVRYLDDFSGSALGNVWTDAIGAVPEKRYVVQTAAKVVARCVLMTTDPGDLVLDPTCGSGTTAFVAEQYGRRWITIDTSRVAMAIARERLLTAKFDYYKLLDQQRGVDGGLQHRTLDRVTLRSIARGEEPEKVTLWDEPIVVPKTVRVSGPFTVEALSRYAVNPIDPAPSQAERVEQDATAGHVEVLLRALGTQGVPRPGAKPLKLEQLEQLESAGAIQASALADLGERRVRVGISLGPKFGAVTMAQVSDALREAIGYDLVVFAGFAVAADAQDRLGTGKVGGTDVALLLANPDLLVGDLLKNTTSSQTFRLYASPDVDVATDADKGLRVTVNGVDAYDAATGDVTSFGTSGVQAWFLDEDYDGMVFRVSQAFFPVSDGWKKIQQTLRGTVDYDLIEELHGWQSLPFDLGEHSRIAVRVIAQDGNAAELVRDIEATA